MSTLNTVEWRTRLLCSGQSGSISSGQNHRVAGAGLVLAGAGLVQAQMNAATDSLQQSFAGLMLQCAAGDAIDPSASSRVFPFQMTSVRDYITAQLAARG